MAEVIFILGAGASAHAGVPIMSEFFEAACDLYDDHKLSKSDIECFDLVRSAKKSLESILVKMKLDLNNIETLFSLVEMGKLINRFPGLDAKQITALHEAIHRFIIRTIELTTNFIYREDAGYFAPEAYNHLANYMGQIQETRGPSRTSILTFNYDVAMDHALETVFGNDGVDYCLNINKQLHDDKRYKLLKLHGSLNWAKVKGDGHVSVAAVSIRDFIIHSGLPPHAAERFQRPRVITTSDPPIKKPIVKDDIHLEVGSTIDKLRWFRPNGQVQNLPLIVPPTWSKTEYHPVLASVWAQAAKEISEAKYIYVIGYSLPETDLFFRHLLGLGMLDILRLKCFRVYDPSTDVGEKYKGLLGASIQKNFISNCERFNARLVEDYIKSDLERNNLL